jgi:MoaA/NifB/PqqE/SkfB family radical SAM enzyme
MHGVGEPLLNRELPAMIDYLKRRPDQPHVLFNSNAILLTPANQQALIEAGLDEFRISTDAARSELYTHIRGVDAFDVMVDNVGSFAQLIQRVGHGPRLSFWFTAMRENLADLPAIVRLAHRLTVSEVHVQRLVFYGHGLAQEAQSLFRDLQEHEDARLREAETLADDLGISFRASGAASPRKSLTAPGNRQHPWTRCRRPSSLMYITANGHVLPCCFSPFTTRDYAGLVLGNAFRAPLVEIWYGAAYRDFRSALQSDTPPESCDRCGVCWSL